MDRTWRLAGWLVVAAVPPSVAGCGGPPVKPPPDMYTPDPLVVARPYDLVLPDGYDPSRPAPLLLMLHGYTASGALEDAYLGWTPFTQGNGILYAYPNGTKDSGGNRFWNATDGCCNIDKSPVDDVAYLRAVVRDVQAQYSVDSKRIYVTGHSNGGFMSHRLACDAGDVFAAIASLAGATWKDAAHCHPSAHLSVLEIHGDKDTVISYQGGRFNPALSDYPSAPDTVAEWAQLNGCTGPSRTAAERLDLDSQLPGSETRIDRYSQCPDTSVELWTIEGGSHIPSLQRSFTSTVWGFLNAHPKP
jgi:polyhydroxybutyrate depolymerase